MKYFIYILLLLMPSLGFASSNEADSLASWLPMLNRVDRTSNKHDFVQKGEFGVGANISYSTLSTSDVSLLTVFEGIDVSGSIVSVTPYGGYFYKNNRYIGLRLGYSSIKGEISSATFDLGDNTGISFDIPYVSLKSRGYSISVIHRSYIALDSKGRYGLFAEGEITATRRNTIFEYESGSAIKTTDSKSQNLSLNLNPGIAAYILPNVCATVSLGFGGLSYNSVKQYDEYGSMIGGRSYSDFDLKFNLLEINIGVVVHLWRDKK